MTEIQAGGVAPKKYDQECPAQVVNVDDPQRLMRVQVRVLGLFEGVADEDLPWSEYKLPVGVRPNDGFFTPADRGDWVWVDFPHLGDSRRPRITGGMHFCPNDQPNLPHESWVGPDTYTHKRTGSQVSPSPAAYHRDVVLTQHGVLIEIVSGTGEVRVTQKSSGSAIEIDKDGNVTAHSENNLYGSAKANCQLDIDGDLKANVGGDATVDAATSATIKAPEITIDAATLATIKAPQINLVGNVSSSGTSGSGSFEISSEVKVNGGVEINGEAEVDGGITATGAIIDGGGNTPNHDH